MRCILSVIASAALELLPLQGVASPTADLDRAVLTPGAQNSNRTETMPGEDQKEAAAALYPRHRLTYANLLVLRYNPLGGEDQIDLRYRYRLYDKSGLLFRDAHLGAAFTPTVNFALSRIGFSVIANPLAVITLTAGYYFNVWYHTFGHMQSYPSARAAHSDTDLDDGDESGASYGTTGHEVQLSVMLLGKVGPVVIKSDNNFHYTDMRLHSGDRLYYTPRQDVLMPDRGWLFTSDLDIVYLADFGLAAGVRASLVHAFYPDRYFAEGEPTDNLNTPTIRVGPLAAYTFFDKPGKKFNKPTILLIVSWWIRHRYRTGEDVHQAIPYALLGFRFEGTLLSRN